MILYSNDWQTDETVSASFLSFELYVHGVWHGARSLEAVCWPGRHVAQCAPACVHNFRLHGSAAGLQTANLNRQASAGNILDKLRLRYFCWICICWWVGLHLCNIPAPDDKLVTSSAHNVPACYCAHAGPAIYEWHDSHVQKEGCASSPICKEGF